MDKKAKKKNYELALFAPPELIHYYLENLANDTNTEDELSYSLEVSAYQFPIEGNDIGWVFHFFIQQKFGGITKAQCVADYLMHATFDENKNNKDQIKNFADNTFRSSIWPLFCNLMATIQSQTDPQFHMPPRHTQDIKIEWCDDISSLQFEGELSKFDN